MPKKSILVEYILNKAKEIETENQDNITADHFMVALIDLLINREEPLPAEINVLDTIFELEDARTLLGTLLDLAKVKEELLNGIKTKSVISASKDIFVFKNINVEVNSAAEKNNVDVIKVSLYLNKILASPTLAIQKYIIEQKNFSKKDLFEEDEDDDEFNFGLKEEKSNKLNMAEITEKTLKVQDFLLNVVYGQNQAINSVVSGYFQSEIMSQINKNKPKVTFLFAGPPGVGKTFLAEQIAEALELPFMRFDMSEYSTQDASIEFCGSDKVYKNPKEGNVTGYVAKNPRSVVLFDEIEKAHISIIHLFLQILDAGRIRDNYTDEEVAFNETIVVFTTNAGRNLYEDPMITNLGSLPKKKIVKALSSDIDPITGKSLFPAAICSRFASGNITMFNHLTANNLYTIAKKEIEKSSKNFCEIMGIEVTIDDKVPTAIMLAEGGKADARMVKAKASAFFHEELFELLRLLKTDADDIKAIKINVSLDNTTSEEVSKMFLNPKKSEVLVFSDKAQMNLNNTDIVYHITDNFEEAKEILFNNDISIAICDVFCDVKDNGEVLNVEDINSSGRDFLTYVLSRYTLPVYLIQKDAKISGAEFISFSQLGVRDLINVDDSNFEQQIIDKCDIAYRQNNMFKLAKENKILEYRTSQVLSENKEVAEINIFNCKLSLATDAEDSKNILSQVSKPNVLFESVIGAEDAKAELTYFVEYLKDPIKYMRKGLKAPKGVLLYGPPGTGKTLLAKAMAGESDVTFIAAEGNQFLKRYVGEGSEAVHDLFKSARKYAPSILFIDEIDAIGKNRNSADGSDHTGDVLTAFLTEMDGFNTDTTKPVFVLAATNYEVEQSSNRSLDPALLRRFDRRIYVDLPNKEERKKFLEMKKAQSKVVNLSDEQIDNIAVRSTGMSLAELDSVFEMALRNAIRSNNYQVDDASFEDAFETFNSGEKRDWSLDQLERTARHEAGHALICWLSGEKPSYLTVVARGNHGGYMQYGDNESKGIYTKGELRNRIRTALGGRAAEMVYYGTEDGISTGASGDLLSATNVAEQMLCNYGMDSQVGLSYINKTNVSSEYFDSIRKRVNAILEEELRLAIQVIGENKSAIDEIVKQLMDKNYLKADEIDNIFNQFVKK